MADQEFQFANNPRSAVENHVPRSAWFVLFIIAAALIGVLVWAYFANVEQTTRGEGTVIPSLQTQLVENLEPGIISEILVSEGDFVDQDQILIKIDNVGSSAKLGELIQRKLALEAELDRLKSQSAETDSFGMPEDVSPIEAPYYLDQIAVFDTDRETRRQQEFIRHQQLVQKEQALREAEASATKNKDALVFRERELELSRKLHERRAIPEIELLNIERSVSELRSDLKIWESSKARLAAEVEEAKTLIEADRSLFLSKVRERISRANAELSVVEKAILEAEDRVGRTSLGSPVSGVVNKLNVSSIGEVVQAGATIVEIIPSDDRLLIETKIRPQDIAFIRPGLKATVRLSAYDYTKFGTLTGSVERIGADTITDENRETFYQVLISTKADENPRLGKDIEIIPGMIATVEIVTGDRTVFEYLLKPVLKIRDFAFRDPR